MSLSSHVVAFLILVGMALSVYVLRKIKAEDVIDRSVFPKSSHAKLRYLTKRLYKVSLNVSMLIVFIGFIIFFLSMYQHPVADVLAFIYFILIIVYLPVAVLLYSLLFANEIYKDYDVVRRSKDRSLKISFILYIIILIIVMIFIVYYVYPVLKGT